MTISLLLRRLGEERRAKVQSYPDHPERFDGLNQVLQGCICMLLLRLLSGVVGLVSAVSFESSRKGQGDE